MAWHPPPLTAAAANLLDNDVMVSTKAQYKSKVKGFKDYCAKSGANPTNCHPNVVLNFLTGLIQLQDKGLCYQTV